MPISIFIESPLASDGGQLISESQAALEEVYPPEDIFSFDASALAREAAAFFVARDGSGRALGCVALVDAGGYGEIKRLFVRPEGRGCGVARSLMTALEAEAAMRGLIDVRLETGDRLAPAVRLYQSLGYRARGPFGSYAEHPASLFMEKRVA